MTLNKIKRFVYDAVIIGIITGCLAEISFRLCYPYLPEKISILVEEAKHITYCNTRLHPIKGLDIRGIILPPYEQKNLAFVGDSFAFGHYVQEDSGFVSIIQRTTQQSIVNLGITFTHTAQYNRMSVVSLNYTPKHLYYCLFTGNDFGWKDMDTTQQLLPKDKDVYLPKDPFVKPTDVGLAVKLDVYSKKIMNYSLLLQFLKLISTKYHTVKDVPIFYTKDKANNRFSLIGKNHFGKMFQWEDERVQRKFEVITNRLVKVNTFAKENGMQLHVIILPFKEIIYSDFVPEKTAVAIPEYYDYIKKLETVLIAKQIDYYDATPDLYEKAKQGEKLFFTFDGHFNERGNAVMADLLIKRFNLAAH